jgi:hypothetical protein
MKSVNHLMLATVILAATLVTVGSSVRAQVQVQPPLVPAPSPMVLSGSDIGFRIEGRRGDTPVGTWVVRIDGRWIEPELLGGGVRRLTAR